MNLARSIMVQSFMLISGVYGIAGSVDQKMTYRMQANKAESAKRAIEIENLRKRLIDESLFSQGFTTELTGNEVIPQQ